MKPSRNILVVDLLQDSLYNEVVSYAYDLGGQLCKIDNSAYYTYLDNVTYDRFGAKVSQEYGNGMVTNYSYNNLTRRLSIINTMNGNSSFSSQVYTYDPVGNVTQVTSSCPWLPNHTFSETFTYNASDQLTSATESQSQSYQLAVTYGDWGKINGYNITQTDLQSNVTQSEAQSYTYPATNSIGGSQSLFAPASVSIQKTGQPHSVQSFTFGINGSLRKREIQFPVSSQNTEYYLFNSAANLKAYSNNGLDFAYYGYNASNARTYKLSMQNMGQWVNGQPQPIHLQIQQAMFYPNAYLNFNQNGEYTKHYYNGAERIASRLGTVTLNNATTSNSRLDTRSGQLEDRFRNDIRTLVYAGDIPMDMPPEPVSATLQTTGTSSDIFYYHTNHLGSTAFVTDQNQNVTQGFLYAPFGEITTEYNATFGNDIIPKYSFNAKELDEETGMYYYEARYYKPPVFTSRDPMFEKYFWMTPYAYCANNPVKYVDPDGEEAWEPDKYGNLIADEEDDALTLSEYLDIPYNMAFSIFYNLSNWDNGESINTGIININGHKLTNIDTYLKIGNIAEYYANNESTDWNYDRKKDEYPAETNKCNIFCADVINAAGASLLSPNIINPIASKFPFIKKKYGPPFAGQWANPKYDIPNWRVLNANEVPRRGDIAAYQYNYSDASGHMAIVIQNGYTIGTSSRYNKISKTKFGFDPLLNNGQKIIFRRYTGR